ncbi:MAG: hypothetical protein NC452_14895 [Eubacterium sp.]|nr:hypothetical protein [Eubacterium sp.]
MTKLKKTIASLAACALTTSALALNVGAFTFYEFGNNVRADAFLNKTSTSATASTTLNTTGGTVYVSIVGHYYANGSTDISTNSNGNGGTTNAQTTIINKGGSWISGISTHSASYNGTSTPSFNLTF